MIIARSARRTAVLVRRFALSRWDETGLSGRFAQFLLFSLVRRMAGPLDFGAIDSGSRTRFAMMTYLRGGERWKPHPLFDPVWYQSLYPDVAPMPALVHYVLFGFNEGRSPHPIVHSDWIKKEFRGPAHFFNEWEADAGDINPFLTGPVSQILVSGETGPAETPYFDAEWIRHHYEDARLEWMRNRLALDLSLVAEPLAFWTQFGRHKSFPPSPHELELPSDGEHLDGQLIAAIQAEHPNTTLLRLEPSGDFLSVYEGAECVSMDRLVIPAVAHDEQPLGRHPELLATLSDVDLGLKSRNYLPIGTGLLLLKDQRADHVPGSSIHLMHEYASNYFHALIEVAGRYCAFLSESELSGGSANLLVDEALPRSVQEFLSLLRHHRHSVHLVPAMTRIRTETLVYPREVATIHDVYRRPPESGEQNLDESALRRLREVALNHFPKTSESSAPLGRHIWIERTSASRMMHGLSKVRSDLITRGYRPFSPNPSTRLADQISLFRSADVIVSPTGAALANALFMREGAHLVVLSGEQPSLAIGLWDQIASVAGVSVTHVRGPIVRKGTTTGEMYRHHDYQIDSNDVVSVLAALEVNHD
jgi:hypothetical protein